VKKLLFAFLLIVWGCNTTEPQKDFFNNHVVLKANETKTFARITGQTFWLEYAGVNEFGWHIIHWPGLDGNKNFMACKPGGYTRQILLFYGSTNVVCNIVFINETIFVCTLELE